MSLRGASGKFSLSNFTRKASGTGPASTNPNNHPSEPNSPTRGNGAYTDDDSPVRDTHGGGGGGGGGVAFDGLGKKLKGSFAHQSLLPGLGNKDMRALQDIITTEKGVLQMSEKLAIDTQKAASALPAYGIQEGPDLQDILTQSSTLLGQLTTALNVFASHQANMRSCYKRIREREELLMELRSRRRSTGQKADTAERKLAKMGPENKQLPQQTELLERLRTEMRNMDQDIVTEETKIGDFKRQVIKEALSLKFGGLEELGEKMCIIGELGKLLLEEVPLEETPVGYGRAPYTGYEKTENAVNEATRCLSTVQFSAGNTAPKPPGLPEPPFGQALGAPSIPREEHNIAAAEEYANYPGNVASPDTKGKGREFSLDTADPYGGITHNPYGEHDPNSQHRGGQPGGQSHPYSDFGGTREQGEVMFQGPDDHHDESGKAPHGHGTHHAHFAPVPEVVTDNSGPSGTKEVDNAEAGGAHDYEYEQQKTIDAEEAWKKLDAEEQAWKEQAAKEEQEAFTAPADGPPVLPNPHSPDEAQPGGQQLKSPWEPLNVKRGNTPEPYTSQNNVSPPPPPLPPAPSGAPTGLAPALPLGEPILTNVDRSSPSVPSNDIVASPTHLQMPTRPAFTPGTSEFYTPTEIPDRAELFGGPRPGTPPATGGKISAAAFRRGTKPRGSLEPEESSDSNGNSETSSKMIRRLPVPPPNVQAAGIALPASPAPTTSGPGGNPYDSSFPGARNEHSPPPGYHDDSLR
ncbi:hypothetical protein I316_05560 [Kwoniella heveanensis BCC8398]|uniref:Eisosome component PIL1-domain-containing protein n=1 Tax=Kwoniella heveanensis BCC8398 TaxID=1296120 RepID=A0A1B9GNH0_9TREE|nr:hypothetical protein I316_05560 [Kwoniella heveanensis BCC8398]